MKSHRSCLASLAALAAFFAVTRAHAETAEPSSTAETAETAEATQVARQSSVQLHVDASAGVSTAGGAVGALGLARIGLLEVGGGYALSGLLSTRSGGGLAVGIGDHRPGGGGVDVLLELGINRQHVRGGLLTSDSGASGTIPYGGLRAGLDWGLGKADAVVHPTLGLWVFARLDLDERTASYSYESSGLFSSRSDRTNGSVQLGGGGELGIAFAGGIDFLP
jgi:hypothetical protein